jgi:hypothetical protein
LWIRRLTCFPCDFIQFFRIQIQIVSVFLCAMYLFFYWIELNNGVLRCGVFCNRYWRHRNAALESERCPNGTTHYISIILDNIQVLLISTFQKYVATIFPMEEAALNFRGNGEHSCLYSIFCRFEPNSDSLQSLKSTNQFLITEHQGADSTNTSVTSSCGGKSFFQKCVIFLLLESHKNRQRRHFTYLW